MGAVHDLHLVRVLRTLAAVALALSLGCGPRFGAQPPLSFASFPYPWPERRLTLASGIEIGYVELNPEGAKTLIFVHGLGSYLKFWRYQLDVMAGKGYRVIALDLPGYGKSDKPREFPYTMEAFAEVLHELIGQLGLDRPIVVGHSMGGHIAMTHAILHPGEAQALVLTSPAGFEKFSARERSWFASVVRTELILGATEEDIWSSVRAANFANWRDELLWLIEERVRVSKTPEFPAYAFANVMSVRGLSRTDFVRGHLSAIQVPTLIVYGSADQLIPNPFLHGGETREVMTFGHRGIEGSELVELAGCGHSLQLDCPVRYNAAVERFLAKLP
jgi:pimeloyl-ACP methyl ester carboxylesterase